MSKTKILFDLITYINAKRIFTAQDVAFEFDVSVRTAYRYLTELSEMGVPIYTESGRHGGYRILDNRLLPPIIFNENEAFAIFFSFQSLRHISSLPFEVDIDSVSRKLLVRLPPDTREWLNNLDTVVSFWNKKRNIESPFLKQIIEAALEKTVILMEYRSKIKNSTKEVLPIGIYMYDGFWYMPAYDILQKQVKNYRVDRILSLTKTQAPCTFDIDLHKWLNNLTTQEPSDPMHVYAELNREGIRLCEGQPWLGSHMTVTSEDFGFLDMDVERGEIEYISSFFLQLGVNARIIEPQELIQNLCSKLTATLSLYDK